MSKIRIEATRQITGRLMEKSERTMAGLLSETEFLVQGPNLDPGALEQGQLAHAGGDHGGMFVELALRADDFDQALGPQTQLHGHEGSDLFAALIEHHDQLRALLIDEDGAFGDGE